MKDKILEQVNKELKLGTRMDLVIMLVVVAVTLIFFAVAAGAADASVESSQSGISLGGLFGSGTTAPPTYTFNFAWTIVCFVTLAVIIFINWGAISVLNKNRERRAAMNEGLARLLKDETLDQYNDGAIYKSYETRYNFFTMFMSAVAALSVIVTVIIFVNQVVTKL